MKKYRVLLLFSVIGMLISGMSSMSASAAWVNVGNGHMYTQEAAPGYLTGLNKIGDHTYYFNDQGIMQTGFQTIQGKRYYFNALGQLQFGRFVASDGKTYYGDKATGVLVTNKWVKKRYYQADGSMAVNTWIGRRYVGANGLYTGTRSNTGWVTRGTQRFYYTQNGTMYRGKLLLDGKLYYLDPSTGAMKTGWFVIGGSHYYAKPNGVLVVNKWKNGRYLTSSGAAATGWQTIGNNTYYLDPATGIKKTGCVKLGAYRYFFDSNGRLCKNTWVNSRKYYASASGVLLTGLQNINGSIYFFKANGKKVTNKLKTVNSNTYYFMKNGAAAKMMWVKLDSNYYYFQKNGSMAKNKWIGDHYVDLNGIRTNETKKTGWQTIDGKKYYYTKKGALVTGWETINGSRYYFNKNDGEMITGLQVIDNKKHYFYVDGRLATSVTIAVGSKEYTIDSDGAIIAEKSIKVSGNSTGSKIVNYAIQFIGNPYVWGGTSLTNGADCSGFVQTVFGHFGIKLLRVADDQMKGPSSAISSDYKRPVVVDFSDVKNMQPGDLVFYGAPTYASHVAIYMGDGKIVHASNSQPYPAGGIKISDYDYSTPVRVVRYWS